MVIVLISSDVSSLTAQLVRVPILLGFGLCLMHD